MADGLDCKRMATCCYAGLGCAANVPRFDTPNAIRCPPNPLHRPNPDCSHPSDKISLLPGGPVVTRCKAQRELGTTRDNPMCGTGKPNGSDAVTTMAAELPSGAVVAELSFNVLLGSLRQVEYGSTISCSRNRFLIKPPPAVVQATLPVD